MLRSIDPPLGRRTTAFRFLGMLALLFLTFGIIAADEPKSTDKPEPKPSGIVAGKVTAANKGRLSEMVVYLESTDPEATFALPAETVTVSQKGAKFAPSLLVICKGQKVVFANNEDRLIEHNVFSRSPVKTFDLGLYPPGESKTVLFDEAGEVRLYCSIHRYMDGKILVCPTPWFATVGADGAYRIEGVPPGSYVIKTWQRQRRYPNQKKTVTVEANGRLSIDWEMKRR